MIHGIPEWVWAFLVTIVIVGLIRYAWYKQDRRIRDLEVYKRDLDKKGGVLTVFAHQKLCNQREKEMDVEMMESIQNLKEWIGLKLDTVQKDIHKLSDNMEDKIENKIFKELQKLNRSA